jgi:creatine kinase
VLDLAALGLPELSMRVRVGRNLADFPMPGGMTKDQRVALEAKMCTAFEVLKAVPGFGGGYHSLTPGHRDFRDQVRVGRSVGSGKEALVLLANLV